MSTLISSSNHSADPYLTGSFFPEEEKSKIEEKVYERIKETWPSQDLKNMSDQRISHIENSLMPRLDKASTTLEKLSSKIKTVSKIITDIKDEDAKFFDKIKNLEDRIEKMLTPSEEYQKLQSKSNRDLAAIIITIVSMAALILAGIVAAALLL